LPAVVCPLCRGKNDRGIRRRIVSRKTVEGWLQEAILEPIYP
jgi:hypothetical protein